MIEFTDIRRRRLYYRSWHRGTREADLVLGSFAEEHLAQFDDGQLSRYEALLECPEPDFLDWISGREKPPPEYDHDVTRLILAFKYRPRPT
jgi:antitoxin CptB